MLDDRKTLLLTGASRGIGHATVKRFAMAGWRVLTVSRHPFPDQCPWEGGERNHVQLDLADMRTAEWHPNTRSAQQRPARSAGEQCRDIAKRRGRQPPRGARNRGCPVEAGLQGQPVLDRAAGVGVDRGIADAGGSVVNVTSIAGSRVHPFAGVAYATSKAALAALTREMAHDFGPLGVRVNAIAPGEIDTSILSPGTRNRGERHPDAQARQTGGGRGDDLLSVHGTFVLHQRRRGAHQRRPARLTTGGQQWPDRPFLSP